MSHNSNKRIFKVPQSFVFGVSLLTLTMLQNFPLKGYGSLDPSVAAPTPLTESTEQLQQATDDRFVTVEEIQGNPTYGGRSLQIGERLNASTTPIETDGNSKLTLGLDRQIGKLEILENTNLQIKTLANSTPDGMSVFYVSRGQVRLSLRSGLSPVAPATSELNSSKRLDIPPERPQTIAQGRRYPVSVETPGGVAGVQGTSFGVNVGPDGKTAVATLDGTVATIGQEGQEVLVPEGRYVVLNPGEPAAISEVTPEQCTLKIRSLDRLSPRHMRVVGRAYPLDILYINGEAIQTDAEGWFAAVIHVPRRMLEFSVRGPAVRRLHYSIPI
jgi:hypothetical protein